VSTSSISIQGLSKRYIIGHQVDTREGLSHALEQTVRNPWAALKSAFGQRTTTREEFWALRDVNLEIGRGEVVGVIGRNGAGKSTLLKILSRITEPTAGRIRLRGRVASLLEVGTGFHPELTGRENVFLNGAILGMSRSEIKQKFEEIVAFAEVEQFLDTPVKRYSNGMHVRLAFAVAAHLEPDILLVDEVLAVGDTEFQQKCLGKMEEVSSSAGRTILFVSHNLGAVVRLCQRSVLLERGSVATYGGTKSVVEQYLSRQGSDGEQAWAEDEAPASPWIRLRAVRVLAKDRVSGHVSIDEPITIEVESEILRSDADVVFGLSLYNATGTEVLSSANFPSATLAPDPWFGRRFPQGIFRTCCTLPANLLNDGRYSVTLYLMAKYQVELTCRDVVTFVAHDTGAMRAEYTGEWSGVVRPRLHWHTQPQDAPVGLQFSS
jgi:lipopolysaccharide transport system ATP-binding protein